MANEQKVIGNYRIITELALGSFGRVYQARHIVLTNRIVALKQMHTAPINTEQEGEQFLQEARFLELLQHPYILPILDVGVHEGIPYLVSEYAPGGSLRDRLRDTEKHLLPFETSLTLLSQIGQALHKSHLLNVIHRDLKPENILFNAKGEALLADFGLSTVLGSASMKSINNAGTPRYMAPEQIRGHVCRESDQYALGCMAYELFTGQPPFTAPDPAALMFMHVYDQPQLPTQINPDIPAYIEQAIVKAMAKERLERHTDIRAFMAALQLPTDETLYPAHVEVAALTDDQTDGRAQINEGTTLPATLAKDANDAEATVQVAPKILSTPDEMYIETLLSPHIGIAHTPRPSSAQLPAIAHVGATPPPLPINTNAIATNKSTSRLKVALLVAVALLIIIGSGSLFASTLKASLQQQMNADATSRTGNNTQGQSIAQGGTTSTPPVTLTAGGYSPTAAGHTTNGGVPVNLSNTTATTQANVNATASTEAWATQTAQAGINASANANATATAQAGIDATATAQAGIDATATAQAGINATATAQAQAGANATATAQAGLNATATAQASNGYVGGVDFNSYCQMIGYTGATLVNNTAFGWQCTSSAGNLGINVTKACQWLYVRGDLTSNYTNYNDPNSWGCYSNGTQSTNLGGINVAGYCQSIGYVNGSLDGSTAFNWNCDKADGTRVGINMDSACQWQYSRNDVTAIMLKLSNPYSWQCYTT